MFEFKHNNMRRTALDNIIRTNSIESNEEEGFPFNGLISLGIQWTECIDQTKEIEGLIKSFLFGACGLDSNH